MKVSVIVPCFNAADTITTQLEALANQEWSEPWEVIVSDNGSSDQSVAIAQQYQQRIPLLRIVDSSDQQGAAHARDVGAKVAQGESLLFTDADDEVAPGWVAAMGEALSKYDFVTGHNEHKKLNEPWLLKCYQVENGTGITENSYYLPFSGGSNLGIKRSLHDAVGGFDEKLLKVEDVDYCWRVQQTGAKLHYVPDALVHFRLRNTIAGIYRRAWGIGEYEALMYKKHRPLGMPQLISWKSFIKTGIILTSQLVGLKVHDKASLAKWLMELAWRGGQLQGCIKHRYLPI